jgi:hypothetical protein
MRSIRVPGADVWRADRDEKQVRVIDQVHNLDCIAGIGELLSMSAIDLVEARRFQLRMGFERAKDKKDFMLRHTRYL